MDQKKNDKEEKQKENYFEEIKKHLRNSNIRHSSRRSIIVSLLLLTLFIASIKLFFSS